MFYEEKLNDHIRVSPDLFGIPTKDAVIKQIKKKYDGYISEEFGTIIDVIDVDEIGEGVIVPGDGANFFNVDFKVISFRPELQEVVPGKIRDLADFGAFLSMGPIEGMIHISQTMDDFVSFGKDKVLQGKETGRNLKIGDFCKARIVAISYKDLSNPKIGLTMRQQGLGKPEWWTGKAKAEEVAKE